MDPYRAGRNADASGSRGQAAAGNGARKPRKKPKTTAQQLPIQGPIPAPYLAMAPSPVSALSQSRIDEMAASRSNMVLPSSYSRSSSHPSKSSPGPSQSVEPSGRRAKYAAGLLAPPAIMPGGQASTPRVQGRISPAPQNPRRRSADRVGVGGSTPSPGPVVVTTTRAGMGTRRRSEERLRELGQVNSSMMSLGHLGHIMETDPISTPPIAESSAEQAPTGARRRRRVVRTEAGPSRRPTVSSREEGRALGVARGASMRRTNVWDDLPESSDPPPAFPFPTPSTSRLPPAFDANSNTAPPPQNGTANERPRSPPPSFEQAIGLAPVLAPATPSAEPDPPAESTNPSTPRARPNLSLRTTEPVMNNTSGPPSSTSPTGTQYASAPTSPLQSEESMTDNGDEEISLESAREDRRLWNADLLAGYSLEERVRREAARREAAMRAASTTPQNDSGGQVTERPSPRVTAVPEELPSPPSTQATQVESGVPSSAPGPSPDTECRRQQTDMTLQSDTHDSRPTTPVQTSQSIENGTPLASDKTTPKQKSVALTPEASSPTLSPLQSPSTPRASMKFMLPPVVVSPFQPSPGFSRSTPSNPAQSPLQSAAKIHPEDKSTLDESTPVAPAHSSKTADEEVQSQSGSGSDQVVSHSPPTRKLTRGKAIRRSSSSPKVGPVRAESVRSKRSAEPQKPLFSSPGYTATELDSLPISNKQRAANRLSAPGALAPTGNLANDSDTSRPLRERMRSTPDIRVSEKGESRSGSLPPHREAALKRRESALGRMQQKADTKEASDPANSSISIQITDEGSASAAKKPSERSNVSGPLIDLNEPWPISTQRSPPKSLETLAATTAELLQLLEDEPRAESSAQGAAKAAALKAVTEKLNRASSPESAQRKKPPPPPPSLRLKVPDGSVRRKPSVLSSADTPLTPRPTPAVSPSEHSDVTTKARPPAIPTRRPPPPPPPVFDHASRGPPLPPRPEPPRFEPSPPEVHRHSLTASETDSSVSERTPSLVSPPVPDVTPRARTSLSIRPRGPRPPPVPPRPWAKVVTAEASDHLPARPSTDRTLSDTPPAATGDTRSASPPRSASAVDLRAPARQLPSPEYTDLDVFVSRLEGSGREYEGFAHITSFLGPAKNPAATPAALATLLPGLIQVDSRRTNAAGKIKLKLSLLGVRVTKCPICLSQFKEKDKAVMLPLCGHVGHEVCARRWFRENRTCFVCRLALAEEG